MLVWRYVSIAIFRSGASHELGSYDCTLLSLRQTEGRNLSWTFFNPGKASALAMVNMLEYIVNDWWGAVVHDEPEYILAPIIEVVLDGKPDIL